MNAVEIHREVRKHREHRAACEQRQVRFATARGYALAAEPARFRQADVDAANDAMAHVTREIANLDARIAALEAQLPSVAEVREADARAAALIDRATETHARFGPAWTEFMTVIDGAESAARAVATIYAEHRAASLKVQDLANRFALDVQPPAPLKPHRNEMKLAGLVGALVRDIGFHVTVDGTTDRALRSARSERAQCVA